MKNNLHDLSGEDKNQFLTLCDKKGRITGIARRSECHLGKGKIHLAFMVFVFDNKGKIVLAKRNKKKSLWGGVWDVAVVSHVLPKETVVEAARRRAREEIGLNLVFKQIGEFYYFKSQNNRSENEYCYVLRAKTLEDVDPNPVEIEQTKKISLKELKKQIQTSPDTFSPWLKIALEKYF